MKKKILIFTVYLLMNALLFADRAAGADIFGPLTINTQAYTGEIGSDIYGPVTANTQLYSGKIGSDIFDSVTIHIQNLAHYLLAIQSRNNSFLPSSFFKN